MPIQFDNFDQNKIDRLKNHLSAMAEKGKAKFYEIFVDTLKAVIKTDEVSDFDSYEDYMNADTEQIKIIIYNSAQSPRNDQFVFLVKARNREEATNLGLSGMPIKKFSRNNVNEWREEQKYKGEQHYEINRLKRELAEKRRELEDKEDYIEKLEDLIEKAKKNGNKIGGVHLGDVLSVALDGLITKGTFKKIPILSGLAGLVKSENADTQQTPESTTEATFEKLDTNAKQSLDLSEEDKQSLELIKHIQSQFNENEFGSVLEILDALNEDKTLIPQVLEFINEEVKEEEK